jgi:predicted RNase H-like HicB family nuclease
MAWIDLLVSKCHYVRTRLEDKSIMAHHLIIVRADWDDEARVWVASSDDLPGLNTEAATLENLRDKVLVMASELIELGNLPSSDLPEIPIHILAESSARIPNPRLQ